MSGLESARLIFVPSAVSLGEIFYKPFLGTDDRMAARMPTGRHSFGGSLNYFQVKTECSQLRPH